MANSGFAGERPFARSGSASRKKPAPARRGSPPWNVNVTRSFPREETHSATSFTVAMLIRGEDGSELQQ